MFPFSVPITFPVPMPITTPAGEPASITTQATRSRVSSRPKSASVVFADRNVADLVAVSYRQQTELNLPKSMARMRPSIARLRVRGKPPPR